MVAVAAVDPIPDHCSIIKCESLLLITVKSELD